MPLLPVFSKLCAERDAGRSQLVQTLRVVFWPMALFGIGAATACAVGATPLMELLYHGRGSLYVPVFRVVIFGLVPIGMTYIFGTLLTAGGYLRQLNLYAGSSLALNVVLNVALIPRLGAVGSAWASLGTQAFMAAAQMLLAARLFRLPAEAFRPPSATELKQLVTTIKNNTPTQ